ncbi:hypothetical protein [Sphingomonas oligoaromativorans]|uniref:hypothetical protein n=1 Tax=Sphingomonas oligoaromativorans TaxID=575322 RepID=UPI0014235C4D|nr:hypothetical protein [Sphingomonas oligoaromativorans]NIJ33316.1 outer membrane murein-binding lipoprotein Lpp [Sphingomonas oligoaromativorans]
MKLRSALLAAAAANILVAGAAGAATAHKPRHKAPAGDQQLQAQVKALREEVEALRSEIGAQKNSQVATQAQVDSTNNALQATRTEVQAVQTQVAATLPVTREQVNTQIASAIDKEHHNSKLYFKGITITPGGYLELAGIYRQHFQGNDISSSFSIPFPNNRASHTSEGRFSARQSRLSFLAEGAVNPHVQLGMYGEFDFQGGAQTANSNQSNSYNPRIRTLYGTIDWNEGDHGWHLLAGQNWSLLTTNAKGITPRAELTPPQIDAQYVPGFAWARQPGIRLAGDFLDHKLWIAVAAENPQTTFAGTVPPNVTNNQQAGSGFDSANTLSLNHLPDGIAKIAYDTHIAGNAVHVEGFGLVRSFDAHLNGAGNNSATGYGYGGSIVAQIVPGVLDAQFSGIGGKGIGRYGSAGLPDVTFSADGRIHPLNEFMLLGGATLHATRMLDLYAFAGEEQEDRKILSGGTYGVGLPTANNSGCFIEGGACAGNTRRIRQLTAGFWEKLYQGSYGRAQVGIQYSYTQRQLFAGVGGMPQVSQNMGFLSFRYYPF